MESASFATQVRRERLDWESEHFGFSVERLHGCDLSREALSSELAAARRARVELVVLSTGPETSVAPELLTEFAGALTDRKATFRCSLAIADDVSEAPGPQNECIKEYGQRTASPELLHLTLAAGVFSRFAVDPRFPRALFENMYRIWIERSVRQEIADVVLVACDPARPAELSGFLTLSLSQEMGKIGLIAVAERARGRGVGRRLVTEARRWLRDRGAREAQVVTQLANAPACSLYRACGYTLAAVEHYYHFWPTADS
jgi:dTDP-4-amino-4,6-dideoxy-D-galactose acyltransferase